MYKLYNFHLLNNLQPSYNLKLTSHMETTPYIIGNTNNQNKQLQIPRNFLSIITNATAGKGCSSCGAK